jgi:CRISPR-associated endonuclease Csn1
VVYVKGNNVSEFRHEYNFLKSRLVNDFHHAKDAYLNIVVGNVYDTKFTTNPLNFIRNEYALDEEKNHYHMDRMFDWDVKRNGRTAWIGLTDRKNKCGGTIETVRKVMSRNTPLMTRMSYVQEGKITNKETLWGARTVRNGNEELYLPQKSSDGRKCDVTKYGGYTTITTGYFCVIEHLLKNKRVRTIETVPSYLTKSIKKDEQILLSYCETRLKLKNPRIIVKKIAIKSLISRDGYRMYLSAQSSGGKQYKAWNAVNLCLDQNNINYIRLIEKFCEKSEISADITKEKNMLLYKTLMEKHNLELFKHRLSSIGKIGNALKDGWEKFQQLAIEDQCYILYQILLLSSINETKADLSKIGGAKNADVITVSETLSEKNHLYLINQSVTGIYEQVIDLLTV